MWHDCDRPDRMAEQLPVDSEAGKFRHSRLVPFSYRSAQLTMQHTGSLLVSMGTLALGYLLLEESTLTG